VGAGGRVHARQVQAEHPEVVLEPPFGCHLGAVGTEPRDVLHPVGTVALDRPGPFGYTARVVPHHRLVATPAELGLATLPPESSGMDAGILR
jgi:starch phosphorylase